MIYNIKEQTNPFQHTCSLPKTLSKCFEKTSGLGNQLSLIEPQIVKKANDSKKNSDTNKNLNGKITEIITTDEQEDSLEILLPLLATLSKDDRWFAWISPPKNLPKALLRQAGIALDKIMLLYPDEQNSTLNIAAKALSAGTCHAVISWSGAISEYEFASLQKSAKTGSSHGILIRNRYSSQR